MNKQGFSYNGPMAAVDLVIEYRTPQGEKIPLIERLHPPYGLALPGGMLEREDAPEGGCREGKEETSLDVAIYSPRVPLCVHSHPQRDPRGHVMSIAYVGRGHGSPAAMSDAKRIILCGRDEIERLVLRQRSGEQVFAFPDHADILDMYLRKRQLIDAKLPNEFRSIDEERLFLERAWGGTL